MANKHTSLNSLFTAIADAIRAKNNSADVITADNFPIEIENLRTGFDYSNQNVTSISDYEFYNCTDLKSVDCYNLMSIGTSAFENCNNLKSAILYDGVETVGENVFKGCSDELIIYCEAGDKPERWHKNWNPNNLEVIWKGISPVKTLDVSATDQDSINAKAYISANGFYHIIDINGVGNIADYADASSAIPGRLVGFGKPIYLIIRNGVLSIGASAFALSKLINTNLILPKSVTTIGDQSFYYCKNLTSITIPDSVTNIRSYAFANCTSLTSINYEGTTVQWNAIILDSGWNSDTPDYIIHCTDGDITKDGTITPKSLEEVTNNG